MGSFPLELYASRLHPGIDYYVLSFYPTQGDVRNFGSKTKKEETFWEAMRRWEYNLKWIVRLGYENLNLIHVTQDKSSGGFLK
jgi:hypothetical protein